MKTRHDMVTVFVVRPDESGRAHEFLQLQRAADDYMGGTWQIIRGGADDGEHMVQAALRELLEETGLIPLELYRLGTAESFYIDYDDTLWHAIPFCVFVSRDQPVILNPEHEAFRWVPREQMMSRVMWASERQLLSDLCLDVLDNGPGKPMLQIDLSKWR